MSVYPRGASAAARVPAMRARAIAPIRSLQPRCSLCGGWVVGTAEFHLIPQEKSVIKGFAVTGAA